MNHAFALTGGAGPHFADPGRMERWVIDLVGSTWLVTYLDGLPIRRRHPSKYSLGPMLVNFIDQIKVVNQ